MAALRVLICGLLLVVGVVLASSLTRTPLVSACTYSLRDSVRAADLIVVGTVDDIRVLPAESDPLLEEFDLTPVEIQLAVSDYLKGVGSEDLLVYRTAVDLTYEGDRLSGIFTSRTDCGRAVGLGEHCVWLLAHRDSTHYETITPAGCTADQSAAAINADGIRQLLEEQATTAPTVVSLGDVGTGPTGSGSEFQWLLAATAGSGAAMLLAGAALRRRTF